MMVPLAVVLGLLVTSFSLLLLRRTLAERSRLPLPPGPPRGAFLGNLRQMPLERAPLVFHEWSKEYGDVMYLRLPGRDIVVLDSLEAAQALLDKRSATYSDRPRFHMYELLGWSLGTTMMAQGKRHTKHRQMHHAALSREKCADDPYRAMLVEEARALAANLVGGRYGEHEKALSRYSASVIARVVAGHKVVSDSDPFLRLSKLGLESLCRVGAPGATIIDALPFMKHFPRWFPGMHYARIADEWRPVVKELFEYPTQAVQAAMSSGSAGPSYLSELLEDLRPGDEEHLADIKGSSATIFSAGDATTWSAITSFVLAMVVNPEAQKRAQEEIRGVVGIDRLPEFGDRKSLPYVECLMEEVFRWRPGVPLGVPHRAMEEDTHRGMRIPKGAIIFANITGMSMDPAVYTDPHRFLPERYLAPFSEPLFAPKFGFGRRVCSGQHLADAAVWIAIVTILATCSIERAVDVAGREIIPEGKMTYGLGSHPLEFDCVVRAQHGQTEKLLNECLDLSCIWIYSPSASPSATAPNVEKSTTRLTRAAYVASDENGDGIPTPEVGNLNPAALDT
ncbi:Cytochrome P450 [Mycena kentingensis (nom. inval.)]|nr:Cytochrome P450 [Mycena kentingensis (nom. inval.)]